MIKTYLAVIAIILSLSIVGSLAFEDDVLEGQRYCEMVNSGAWGAYKENVNCTEE